MRSAIITIAALPLLAACATIAPSVSTESCLEKVAAGEIMQTEAMNGLNDALEAAAISGGDAVRVDRLLDGSNALLDSAARLCVTETRTAFNVLAEARKLVFEAKEILDKKQ